MLAHQQQLRRLLEQPSPQHLLAPAIDSTAKHWPMPHQKEAAEIEIRGCSLPRAHACKSCARGGASLLGIGGDCAHDFQGARETVPGHPAYHRQSHLTPWGAY